MSKLAIIGTAGRGDDGKRLAADPERYRTRMLDAARKVAELTHATTLVSGAAAWADHIAIDLFLEPPTEYALELELPAPLEPDDAGGYRFLDKGTRDFKSNPGGVSNHYHRLFKDAFAKTGTLWSPFLDFAAIHRTAMEPSAVTFCVGAGFLERNLVVAAKADCCLAMTFGNGAQLKDGGTAHTMKAFLAKPNHGQAFHLDLNTLTLYKGARV
jgi:hypothetical protein